MQRVRVLGALALVDGGETDWKLLVVDADDSSTSAWRTVDDVPRDRVAEARDWYRLYKTAEGKGENEYGMGGRAIDGDEALRVAVGTHRLWRDWVDGKAKCDFDGEACWK